MQRRVFPNRSLHSRQEQRGRRWEDCQRPIAELVEKGAFVVSEDGSKLLEMIQTIRWSQCSPSRVYSSSLLLCIRL